MADVKIVLTNVYNRCVLFYIDNTEVKRIRVIGDEPAFPIGTIVMARVKKLMPSSGACFVDIGDDTDYFLQIPGNLNLLVFGDGRKHEEVRSEDLILVQVSSEGVKLKSPGVTGNISLNSRHLVIEGGKGISFSSKLSPADREGIELPENIGAYSSKYHIIVRTEAKDLSDASVLSDEIEDLADSYEAVMNKASYCRARNVLYRPEGYLESVLGDWIKYGCDEIVTDIEAYSGVLSEAASRRGVDYRFYEDEYPLCKLHKLETCIDQCLARKVYIKSGAFLVIEQGETLTAIDVNSGHDIKGNKEETSYKINLNAASEILKQLRLRNISGMILIDFINMKDAAHLESLINETRSILKEDDVLCRYVDVTGLGLMEITRKRVYKSFLEQWKA